MHANDWQRAGSEYGTGVYSGTDGRHDAVVVTENVWGGGRNSVFADGVWFYPVDDVGGRPEGGARGAGNNFIGSDGITGIDFGIVPFEAGGDWDIKNSGILRWQALPMMYFQR